MSALLRKKLRRDAWAMRGRIILLSTVVAAGMALAGALYQSYGDLRESYDHMYEANQLAHLFIKMDAPGPVPAEPAGFLGSHGIQHVSTATTRLSLLGVIDIDGEPVQAQFIGMPSHAWPKINDICVRAEKPWNYACTPGEKARATIVPIGTMEGAFLHAGFSDAQGIRHGERLEATILGQSTFFNIQGVALNSEFLFPWTNPQLLIFDPGASAIVWVAQEKLEELVRAQEPLHGNDLPLATDMLVRMTPGQEETKARRAVQLYDAQPERFAGLGWRSLEVREDTFIYQIAESDIEGFQQFSPIVAFIGLMIATVTIAVTMDRLVVAQRSVIGILRALGAGPIRLVTHYLGLAIAVGFIGAVAGTGLAIMSGAALSEWYRSIIGFPVLIVTPRIEILTTLAILAMGACAIGGLRAAVHAARLPITTAMRPPASRTPGGWLRRATQKASLATRLAVRNLTRAPRRVAFTLSGMSLSIVMTFAMVGLYTSAIVALDEQFTQDAWDGLVTLDQPQPQAAVESAMAGVSWIARADPFLQVPAVVKGMEDPTLVTGLGRESLKELDAIRGDARLIPGNGVVAPVAFIQDVEKETGLSLQLGTPFQLVIDGQAHDVKLVGVINDLLATTIYFPLTTLQDFVGAPVATGAYVEVASGRTPRASDLEVVPGFVDLTLKAEVEESFEEALGDSIQFALLFAGVGVILGIIVILNTSAVNLQERALEHGTLKALGLPNHVIVRMLAIEHLAIGVIAAGIGIALGYLGSLALLNTMAEDSGLVLEFYIPPAYVAIFAAVAVTLAQIPTVTAIRSLRRLDLPSLVKAREG